MSLLNANAGNGNVSTIHVTKIYRNTRAESFGESTINDFVSALGPAARITSAIYRRKALRAVNKRNRVVGTSSAYIDTICNYSAGNTIGVSGLTAEANFFNYIINYCKMEVYAFRTAGKIGGLSPKLQSELANPPHPATGYMAKQFYVIKVNAMCTWERLKALKNKVVSKIKSSK